MQNHRPHWAWLTLVGIWAGAAVQMHSASQTSSGSLVERIVGASFTAPNVQQFLRSIQASAPQQSNSSDGAFYRTYPSSGISLLCDSSDRIVTVFLYVTETLEYRRYRYSLPLGLTAEDDRGSVTRELGLPDCAGGGEDGVLGRVKIWDAWIENWGTLHIQYGPKGTFDLITLMVPSRDPGCRRRPRA